MQFCTIIQQYCYITLQITILIADYALFSVQSRSNSSARCTSLQQTLLLKARVARGKAHPFGVNMILPLYFRLRLKWLIQLQICYVI